MSTPGAARRTCSIRGTARTAMIESSARMTKRRSKLSGSEGAAGWRTFNTSSNAVLVGSRRPRANSVGTSWRPARTNNGSPRTLRNRPRERETAGGERWSRAAAPATEPDSSRASSTRRRLRSMSAEFIKGHGAMFIPSSALNASTSLSSEAFPVNADVPRHVGSRMPLRLPKGNRARTNNALLLPKTPAQSPWPKPWRSPSTG